MISIFIFSIWFSRYAIELIQYRKDYRLFIRLEKVSWPSKISLIWVFSVKSFCSFPGSWGVLLPIGHILCVSNSIEHNTWRHRTSHWQWWWHERRCKINHGGETIYDKRNTPRNRKLLKLLAIRVYYYYNYLFF